MVGCAQAAQVFRGIRPTLCQRYPVMHQRCLSIPSFGHAHLTQRLPCQLRSAYPAPCSRVVPFPVCWAAEEPIVLPVGCFPMHLAELSVCQIWTAGMPVRFQGLSRHTSHLHTLSGQQKSPHRFYPAKASLSYSFLWTVLFNLSSIIISRRKHLCNHFSRNIVEHS